MKIAITKYKDPYLNLATEEIILKDKNIKEDILLLYINNNAIILGRNQNIHAEINYEFLQKKNIKLSRRVSGGGAVYHDSGNINFSFITNKSGRSYEKFLIPIIDFLNNLGLDAEFKGKNDLSVNGFKVSGNAQYIYKDRMFHHGTLLFDTDLTTLGKALKVNKLKLESKGIKSAHQRVANINSLLTKKLTPDNFVKKLILHFKKNDSELWDIKDYKVNEIEVLSNIRKSDDWLYSKNPDFNVINEKRFEGGTISVNLFVENNVIKEIKFFGDFLSNNDFENIYQKFINQDFTDNNINKIIDSIENLENYFGKISKENIKKLVLGK